MKKVSILLLVFIFIASQNLPLFAASMSPAEYLCEVAIDFYKKGRVFDALHEFNKVLLVNPDNETAKWYIELIQSREAVLPPQPAQLPQVSVPVPVTAPVETEETTVKKPVRKPIIKRSYLTKPQIPAKIKAPVKSIPEKKIKIIEGYLKKTEKKVPVEKIPPRKIRPAVFKEEVKEVFEKPVRRLQIMAAKEKPSAAAKPVIPQVIELGENIKTMKMPLEIETAKSVTIRGKNISRFLITQPDALAIERLNANEISVTGKNLGYTYLHIWDEQDRWTLEFLTIPPKPTGPTLEEEMRIAEEQAKNFRLRYSYNWSSFETGRRLRSLERQSFSWTNSFDLVGAPETPYGNVDFGFSVSALRDTTDLSYVSMGLTNGKIGPFDGFTLRGFDYSPYISNLAFSGGNLRGVLLSSPAFDKKADYTLFWGREGGGRYAGLSPGLSKTRNSFLSGFDLNLHPKEKQDYGFTVAHGWGRDRQKDLNRYGYDLRAKNTFNDWDWKYEVAHDTETFSHLLTGIFHPKQSAINVITELRNTDKDFRTLSGLGSRAGELGLLTNLNYKPYENLDISSRLDVFQDRLFPSLEDNDRFNEDFNINASLQLNPLTSLRADYTLQNYLGRISSSRSQNTGLGISRTFDWIRRINTNLNYRHYLNKNFTSPSLDYQSNKLSAGLGFNLIGDLHYFLNKELSFVNALNTDESVKPHALETGVDWYSRILNTPFYGNMRFTYRDEENTDSAFSFLSGEDYIESYTELSFRPKPDVEAFANMRIRNVWAENPTVQKRVDFNFYSGLRYVWDTGIHWESVGAIDGYVFNDLNADGLRQKDEPAVEKIKLWLGKDKFQITDKLGYYKFKRVRAAKAYVNIDSTTIPTGFVLTVPVTQQAVIEQGRAVGVNFGIITRTEITGIVFEDIDGDGRLSQRDLPIRGVVVILEDGSKATTDDYGRYTFKKVSAGKHKLMMDLKSLPTMYLPAVPIFKDIEISEGMSIAYNFPLKKIGKEQ